MRHSFTGQQEQIREHRAAAVINGLFVKHSFALSHSIAVLFAAPRVSSNSCALLSLHSEQGGVLGELWDLIYLFLGSCLILGYFSLARVVMHACDEAPDVWSFPPAFFYRDVTTKHMRWRVPARSSSPSTGSQDQDPPGAQLRASHCQPPSLNRMLRRPRHCPPMVGGPLGKWRVAVET
jgi:hypothetical protein